MHLRISLLTFCSNNVALHSIYNFIFHDLQRIFDDVFPSIGTTVSDHYGVKVRLSDIREECNFFQKCRFHCVSEIKGFSPFHLDQRDVCID